jgi:mercuric ion transport protein
LLLAGSGLAAALGAAVCCALPVVFGGLGIASASLSVVAEAAAPYRIFLLAAAAVFLATAWIVTRRRKTIACPTTTEQSVVTKVVMALGLIVLILGVLLG